MCVYGGGGVDGAGHLFDRIFQLHVSAGPHPGAALQDTLFQEERLLENIWSWGLTRPETFAPNAFELWSLCQINIINLTKHITMQIHPRILFCPTWSPFWQDDRRTM